MSFPEFDRGKKGLLFFSRGRGRGHAIPDMEIARELLRQRQDIDVRFVSYATGAKTIEQFDFPLIDLDLPELNSLTLTTVLAGKVIGWLKPDLVVSHEEFPALPAAKIFDRRTVFLTDWFVEPARYPMQTLQFADEILFLDEPGVFEEPDFVNGRVTYLGQFLRDFAYDRDDRDRARRELDLPSDATVVSVLPGSYATEQRVPIAESVLKAFDGLPFPSRRLVWIAGGDLELLSGMTQGRADVIVKEHDFQIDRLMVASDVAITKANRKTVLELNELGVPSVAICPGLNPIDEARLTRLRNVISVPLGEATPETLSAALIEVHGRPFAPNEPARKTCAFDVANRLSSSLAGARSLRQ